MGLRLARSRASSIQTTLRLLVVGTLFVMNSVNAETLEQAWQNALEVDHRLRSGLDLVASGESQLEAAKARKLPQISVQGGYTHLGDTPTATGSLSLPAGTLNLDLPLQQPDFYAYSAQVTLPLYTGGRISKSIVAARSMVDSARQDIEGTEQDVKLNVAKAYVGSLRAAQFVAVAQSNVASLKSFALDVENLFSQGVVAREDTLAAKVALAQARQSLITATNGLDLAHAAFNRALGRALDAPVQIDELSLKMQTGDIDELTERARLQRSELKALNDKIDALRTMAAGVRGGLRPQVAVTGGYARIENEYQLHQGITFIGIGVKWDLFDGGLLRSQSDSLVSQAASVASMREELLSMIGLQVRKAWLDTRETSRRIRVAQAAVESAEENLKRTRDRYSQGLANNTEVLAAETRRTSSQGNIHAARYDAMLTQLQLKRAIGEL